MNTGKRFVVLLLALALVLPFVIGAVPANAASGEVTRAEWISRVVETFNMTVDDTSTMPDNYYSDLTTDNPYYQDILLAVEFGLIDIEAGYPFRPNDPATREFAAHTLNFALGFQFDESAGYTFSESSIVTYPNDIQVAINRGWFSLSGGSFMPEQPITASEADSMLADAAQVLAGDMADSGENYVEFAEGVIVVPQGTNVSVDETTGAVTISGYSETIVSGGIFAVYPDITSDMPEIYKAASVANNADGSITIETTAVMLSEAIVALNYSGAGSADFEEFEEAEDATYYVRDMSQGASAPIQLFSIETQSIDYNENTKVLTANKQITLDGINIGSISIKLSSVDTEFDAEIPLWGEKYASFIMTSDVEVSASLEFDLSSYTGIPKSITLGHVGIDDVAEAEVNVDIDLTGGLSAAWAGDLAVGIKISSEDGLRTIREYTNKEFTLTADVNVTLGVTVRAYVDISIGSCRVLYGEIGARAGGKMNIQLYHTSDGTTLTCVTHKGHLYMEIYYVASYDILIASDSSSGTRVIYDENKSPVRFYYHSENGVLVSACTRTSETGIDPDYEYYTSPDSPYFNPAPGYGQSYEDGSGTVVQIYSYEVEEDDAGQEYAVITGYNGGASALAIPSEIDGYEVREIASYAFRYNELIRSVVIPDSVISIGDYAFRYCTNLSNVVLSQNLKDIGSAAFGDCPSLLEIEIPKSLESASANAAGGPFGNSGLKKATFETGTTQVVYNLFYMAENLEDVELLDTMTSIGASAFYDCISLIEIALPNGITEIRDRAFSNCSALTNIVIPDSVISIGDYAFRYCTNLSNVVLSKNLKDIGSAAFGDCPSLLEIEIPKSLESASANAAGGPFGNSGLKKATFETGTTQVVYNLFYMAENLEDVELLDTMTSIGASAFYDCISLTEISLPNSITEIGRSAFYESTSLASIVIPDSVVSIDSYAFEGCTSLSNVTLSKNLKNIGMRVFENCMELEEIEIPKSLTSAYGSNTGGAFGYSGIKRVTFEAGTTEVASNLFWSAFELEEVELLDTMTSIGNNAFLDCTKLSEIIIPESITEIGSSAFQGCTSLLRVVIPNGVTTVYDDLFQGCTNLTSVEISNSITEIPNDMFSNCGALTSVTLPEKLEWIGARSFENCTSLTTISLPETVSYINSDAFIGSGLTEIEIPAACYHIGSSAFENCADLTSVLLNEGVEDIGSSCFRNCDYLTNIAIPNTVEEIGSYAFDGCEKLASVTFGNGIAEIPSNAFSNCPALNNVVIPYGVTEIGSSAFANCTSLTSITIPRTVMSIETNAFSYKDRMTIYGVPGTYAETFANNNGFKFVSQEHNATSVDLNVTNLTLNRGQSYQLTYSIEPPNSTDEVFWRTTNADIVTVEDGLVKAVSTGTATILLNVGESASAQCVVTVVQPVTSVSLNYSSRAMDAWDTLQLTASVRPDNAYNKGVTWSSSDTSVASVDNTGLVTAHKKGEAIITVTAVDGSGESDSCDITVNGTAAYSPEQLESKHNYANNSDELWVLRAEGATYIEVTFDAQTSLEQNMDFLYVYGSGEEPSDDNEYTGTELAGKTVRVQGDTIKIRLVSDQVGNKWGFKVTDLKTDGKLDPYAEIRAKLSSTAALDTDSAKLDAVRDIDTDLLAEAMAAEDSQIAEQLAELESGMSLTSDVIVTDSMSGHFTKDEISVTGAVMNIQNTSSPVTLTIDTPHNSGNYADSQYSSAVEFSMTLGNAIEPLEVPVMVTLPVPAGVEPDALVILHELSDGSVDRVEYTLSVENGQTFAAFVVTEFSDFTLAQVENDMFDAKLNGATASVTVYGSSGSSIVCAAYDADGRILSSNTCELAATWQMLEFDVPSITDSVSFILLDSQYRPVMEQLKP